MLDWVLCIFFAFSKFGFPPLDNLYLMEFFLKPFD